MRGYRGVLGQLPGPGRVARRLRGQGADRAYVDDVAGKFRDDRFFDIGADLHVFAAAGGAEFRHAGDLVAKAHATGAVNAAGKIGRDQRPDILVHDDTLGLGVFRYTLAEAHRHVLQFTLTALVADRTVQRVVDEQEFHGRFLRGERGAGAGLDHHAVHALGSAGRHRLGRAFDFHQAHATVGGYRQSLVIAKPGNHNIVFVGDVDQQAPGLGFDFLTVYRDCYVIAHCRLLIRSGCVIDHRALVLDIVFKFVAEMLDETPYRHRRGVAERADGATLDLV